MNDPHDDPHSGTPEVPRWKEFQSQRHSLRISVSELAACVGFHPYKDLVQLAINHVYQGSAGQELLRHDSSLLGVRLESEEQILMEIAQQAGKSTQQALQSALQVQKGQKRLASVDQAKQLCDMVVQKAKESKKLSEFQIKQLQQGSRHSIHTGFGTCWESQALDIYEQKYGVEVRERNEEIKVWPFAKTDNTVKPMKPAYSYLTKSFSSSSNRESKRQKQTVSVEKGEENDEQKPQPGKVDCFFSLRGAIDGIRDELVPNCEIDNDNDSWVLRPVIVECKHRMNRLQASPPLYEMIQTITYCQMYQVQDADLVQVLRRQPQRKKQQRQTTDSHQPRIERYVTKKSDSKTTTSTSSSPSTEELVVDLTKENTSVKYLNSKDDKSKNNREEGKEKSNGTLSLQQPEKSTKPAFETHESKSIIDSAKDTTILVKYAEKEPRQEKEFTRNSSQAGDVAINESVEATSQEKDNTTISDMKISVNRISLDDPLYQHQMHWDSTILPRLLSWVEAIYNIRGSDDKRYRLLMSSSSIPSAGSSGRKVEGQDNTLLNQRKQEKDTWKILFDECSWLLHCDTRYNRELR